MTLTHLEICLPKTFYLFFVIFMFYVISYFAKDNNKSTGGVYAYLIS